MSRRWVDPGEARWRTARRRARLGVGAAALVAPLLHTARAQAQSAFETRVGADIAITAASWASYGTLTLLVDKKTPPESCLQNPCGPVSDGAHRYSRTWDVLSYVPVSLAVAGALAPSIDRWASGQAAAGQVGDSTLVLAQALGITYALTEAVKIAVPRYRPFLAYGPQPDDPARTAPDANASFWSAHSATAFAAAAIGTFDACRVRSDLGCYAPAIGLHVLAVSTALGRVLAGRHHVSDVVVGGVMGGAIGSAVAFAHPSPSRGEHQAAAAHAVIGSQLVMVSLNGVW
jgi:membrane-associated phospholipid phosphatase